jgi:formylglycine-generating enzyme required for sulfatase activity
MCTKTGRSGAFFTTAVAALVCAAAGQTGNAGYTVSLTGLTSGQKSLDMVFVEGGTFQRGCSTGDNACESTEKPAHSVTLSDYYAGKYEVTNAQWKAVMNDNTAANNQPKTNITWYDAVEFACKLRTQTGKRYRLLTDAEFEYAARGGKLTHGYLYSGSNTAGDVAWTSANSGGGYGAKDVGTKTANELGIYDMSGNVYEWTLDSWGWSGAYGNGGKTNPVNRPAAHTQKTRRGGSYDQPASESRVSAHKIRSIEGKDGSIGFRLALSVSDSDPAALINPCDISQPFPTGAKINFRDERIATADDEAWIYDMSEYVAGFAFVLRLSSNGAARYSRIMEWQGQLLVTDQASGEWYTLNGHSLHIVPASGTAKGYIYLPLCREKCDNLSMMPEADMPGRYERMKLSDFPGAEKVTLPNIAGPRTPEALAQGKTYTDMSKTIPTTGRDPRLIEGGASAWVQDNVAMNAGGTHRYRKDFDSESDMRFVVWDAAAGTSTLLAHGPWFTVDNTFLRVRDPNGAAYDYLYTVTANNDTLYHISFQTYEPADFRMFTKMSAGSVPQWKEPASGTTYNQGASKYVPPSADGFTSVNKLPVSAPAAKVNMFSVTGRTVAVSAPAGSTASVRVVNLAGRTVARFSAAGAANISLQKIPAGAYIIETKIDGRVATRSAVLR